jgi:hypothetical protein
VARKPDIQFFYESGIWHRPKGARKVKVLVKGGDSGGTIEANGTIVPGEQGQLVVREISAKEAGPSVPITIGEAGTGAWEGLNQAPEGMPGYSIVATYFKKYEMLSSLGEFCSRIARHLYSFVVGIIGGVLGLVSAVYADFRPTATTLIPLWIWIPLLAGGFWVATFSAFHDVRLERDQATSETKWRFDILRYALQLSGVPVTVSSAASGEAGKVDIEVGLRFANNSSEALRYEIERMTVSIESLTVGDPQFANQGVIIAPSRYDAFRFPTIRNVDFNWQAGTIDYSVRYGHPSTSLRFRKSQRIRLTAEREPGPPGRRIFVKYSLITDPDVEDVK